jgi:hypothetical protein
MAKYFFNSEKDENDFIDDIVNSPELGQLLASFFPEILFENKIKLKSEFNRVSKQINDVIDHSIDSNSEANLRVGFFC